MTEPETMSMQLFSGWLSSLADDALLLLKLVVDVSTPKAVRERCAAALNYLFKGLDLSPEGLEDLVWLDAAIVLRVSASLLSEEQCRGSRLVDLSQDSERVEALLGDSMPRLRDYVIDLFDARVRGRSVSAILDDVETTQNFAADVKAWAAEFEAPALSRDERLIPKLKAFLEAKLPE